MVMSRLLGEIMDGKTKPAPKPQRKTGMITNGNGWGHPHACDAIGPDGKVRRVRLQESAWSYADWDGRCSYQGETRRVCVYFEDGQYRFRVYDKKTS